MTRTLSPGERELIDWTLQIEKWAILPLRIGLLGLTVIVWEWAHRWRLPETEIFILFFFYAMALIFAIYCLWGNRLTPEQVRPFVISTLAVDSLFVAGIVWLDSRLRGPGQIESDYHLFFFLLVLRGFAVLQRPRDLMLMNGLVLGIFLAIAVTNLPEVGAGDVPLQHWRDLTLQTAQIMMVMALAWFLLATMSRQRNELVETRERLLRTENLATLGEIVAGVAHEINNPVGIISAHVDYLLKKAEDPAMQEDFEVIRSEANRCKQIVRQLLSFANPSVSARRPVDLDELAGEVLDILFLDKQNSLVTVVRHCEPGTPPVRVDEVQIKQALLNIAMNARHAMGPEGKLDIDIRPDPDNRRLVRLTIHDTGPGLSEGALEHLFEPFFTSKDAGTGLGLAITRRIVEAHDGSIEAFNAPEGGAVFRLRLPAAKGR